jgi:hypothetical protein
MTTGEATLRASVVRLAHARPDLRARLLPLVAKEWPSEKSRQKYLDEHPGADPNNHTIKAEKPKAKPEDEPAKEKPKGEDKPKDKPKGDDAKAEKRLKQREEGHKPHDDDLKEYEPPPENTPERLRPEHREEIKEYEIIVEGEPQYPNVGDDAVAAVEIRRRAKEFAEKLKKGIKESADICKVNPPVCEENMGLTRDKMPQITDDSVHDMLGAMADDEYKKLDKQVRAKGLASIEDEKQRKRFLKRAKGEAAVQAGADSGDKRPVFKQFLQSLESSGIATKPEEIQVGKLKATQSEIRAEHAIGMADSHLAGKFPDIAESVVVSRDGHILDGHHRWAAIMTIDPARKMKVKVIDMDMKDLLHEAASFPGVFQAGFDGAPLTEDKQKAYKGKHKSKLKGGGEDDKGDEKMTGKEAALRADLIRLAHAKPELRPTLLPVIEKYAWGYRPRAMPRPSYLPPGVRDTPPETPSGTDLAIWKWEEHGRLFAIAFAGRANKPLWHYSFRSDAHRQKRIDETIVQRKAHLKAKAERQRERRDYRHDYVVGDILNSSWGYDQTNVNFYEVTDVRGKMVVIREISQRRVSDDRVTAAPGRFIGPPVRRKVSQGGSVKVTQSQHASKWDGKPSYRTPAGFGH